MVDHFREWRKKRMQTDADNSSDVTNMRDAWNAAIESAVKLVASKTLIASCAHPESKEYARAFAEERMRTEIEKDIRALAAPTSPPQRETAQ